MEKDISMHVSGNVTLGIIKKFSNEVKINYRDLQASYVFIPKDIDIENHEVPYGLPRRRTESDRFTLSQLSLNPFKENFALHPEIIDDLIEDLKNIREQIQTLNDTEKLSGENKDE